MKRLSRRTGQRMLRMLLLTAGAVLMLYPLLWLVCATFRGNQELFSSGGILPQKPTLDGWRRAFTVYGGEIGLTGAMRNTYLIALPKVLLTLISVTLTAYGFARFPFRGRRLLTALLFSTVFLPQTVLYVPQFMLFHRLGWIDSPAYLPLIVPAACAGDTVLVIALMQFFRSIPKTYDEAAALDGCNSFQTLRYVLVPQLRPVLISVGVLQLLWTVNDYMAVALSGLRVCEAFDGRGQRVCMEPRAGGLPDRNTPADYRFFCSAAIFHSRSGRSQRIAKTTGEG